MFLVPRTMYYSLFYYVDAYCKCGITQMYNLKKVFQCITNPVIRHFVYNYGHRKPEYKANTNIISKNSNVEDDSRSSTSTLDSNKKRKKPLRYDSEEDEVDNNFNYSVLFLVETEWLDLLFLVEPFAIAYKLVDKKFETLEINIIHLIKHLNVNQLKIVTSYNTDFEESMKKIIWTRHLAPYYKNLQILNVKEYLEIIQELESLKIFYTDQDNGNIQLLISIDRIISDYYTSISAKTKTLCLKQHFALKFNPKLLSPKINNEFIIQELLNAIKKEKNNLMNNQVMMQSKSNNNSMNKSIDKSINKSINRSIGKVTFENELNTSRTSSPTTSKSPLN
jgi:hypothetical protein